MPSVTSSFLLALAVVGAANAASVNGSHKSGNAKNVTDFVVFGDSYSDACSSSRLQSFTPEQRAKWPFPYCPPAPWGRASGGESWPEYIRILQGQAVPTDKDSPVQAAYKGEWTIQNLAQSAATCDNAVFPRAPINDVGQQIDLLKTNYNTTQPLDKIQTDPATTWAAIFIGTNDISFYNSTADVAKETDCLERRIQTLHDFGHRKFLILENINLEYVPTYSTNGVVNKTIQSYTSGNRKSQAQLAEKLNKKWQSDGTEVLTFPTFELFSRMYNNPREYGMEYVKVPCVTGTGNNTVTCSHPTKYLWWNDLHPSFHAEQILAAKVVKFLEEGARGEDLLAGPQ